MKKVSYTFVAMVLAGCCAVVCVARESASAVDGTLPLLEACAGNDLAGAQATPFAQAGYHIYTSYAQPDRRAIVYRGVSVARDVVANDYTIGLHVKYADGTDEWPDAPRYAQGTHGPQKLEGVFFPPRPVKEVGLYAFMREGEGAAQFGQLYVGREDAATVRKPTLRMTQRPFAAEDFVCVRTADGVQCSTAQAQPGVAPVSPLASGETRLWWCDAMTRVTPLTFPSAACGARTDPITVKMARREKESVQVCLSTAADVEWRAVRAEVAVEGIEATWQRVGYVAREMGYLPHPCGVPAGERWLPEPLLPPAEMTVRKGATQGVWLTFATRPDTAPGIHRGRVRLLAGARELGAFDIAVDVASCTLPAEFAVRTAVSTSQRFMEKIYGARGAAMYRRACELMLDHALNPDDIGRLDLPDIDELERARARGMNSFCLIFWVPQVFDATQHIAHMPSAEAVVTDEFRAKMKALLTPYLEKLRARGLDKLAYIYAFDEQDEKSYAALWKLWRIIQADYPGIPLMTTSYMFRDMYREGVKDPARDARNFTDWHCPISIYYDRALADAMRASGRQVWWYTCCAPAAPYANFASMEHPPMEGRLLFWQGWQERVDGYLFWISNWWVRHAMVDARHDTFLPGWSTWSDRAMPGDGVLFYPGVDDLYPSLRLAQVRDGVEDVAILQAYAARFGRAAAARCAGTISTDKRRFSRDTALLRQTRDRMLNELK